LEDVSKELKICTLLSEKYEYVPPTLLLRCIEAVENASKSAAECINITHEQDSSDGFDNSVVLVTSISANVQKVLLSMQTLFKSNVDSIQKNIDDEANGLPGLHNKENNDKNVGDFEPLLACHKQTTKEWSALNLSKTSSSMKDLIENLRLASESSNVSESSLESYFGASADACTLITKLDDVCRSRLIDSITFHRSSAKLAYILLRVFRLLVAKGYCSQDASEKDGDGDENGDISNMKFEDDVEGTGMGEGEGKDDVTDQIEDEEQLLGLKNDKDDEDKQSQEQKTLDEKDVDTGMEMENDFDGEMYDVPEPKEEQKDEGDGDDEEEELDREMGKDGDPNEDVIDEKMWDGDDEDDENGEKQEEKFEKDSKVDGEAIEGETRTKENDDDSVNESKDEEGKDNQPDLLDKTEVDESKQDAEDGNTDPINDDTEDKYEENHVDVRKDDVSDVDPDEMDLDDNVNLDDGENESENLENEDDLTDLQDDKSNASEGDGVEMGETVDEDESNQSDDENIDALQSAIAGEAEDSQDNEIPEEPENEIPEIDMTNEKDANDEAHGVSAPKGKSCSNQEEEEKEEQDEKEGDETKDESKSAGSNNPDNVPNQSNGEEDGDETGDVSRGTYDKSQENKNDNESKTPNPFQNPGDAEKFWHQKLNMASDHPENEENPDDNCEKDDECDNDGTNDEETNGMFDFAHENEASTTQVLSTVEEEEALKLEDNEANKDSEESPDEKGKQEQSKVSIKDDQLEGSDNIQNKKPTEHKKGEHAKDLDEINSKDEELENAEDDVNSCESSVCDDENQDLSEEINDLSVKDNKVVTDLAQLKVREDDMEIEIDTQKSLFDQNEKLHGNSSIGDDEIIRQQWAELSSTTLSISRRLCEKLRLVMEPLIATKLKGDYRTGKRINMKRVIGYIASGFRKDKIWLRRTKPAKRDYRVLIAVDNSESMNKGGAGEVALAALATLANGMSQLEIGELGVASFGEDMKLLHPFHEPFTQQSGATVVRNLKFEEKRTRTALCVESAIGSLENAASNSSRQLVLLISDGRIERDNRSKLRRLVREMSERNILLVMIIVEGGTIKKKQDSIVNMKEVSFENGKPKVKHFIEDYPFPYYMILEDINSLPELLGDALRQWFELMAQNQNANN